MGNTCEAGKRHASAADLYTPGTGELASIVSINWVAYYMRALSMISIDFHGLILDFD